MFVWYSDYLSVCLSFPFYHYFPPTASLSWLTIHFKIEDNSCVKIDSWFKIYISSVKFPFRRQEAWSEFNLTLSRNFLLIIKEIFIGTCWISFIIYLAGYIFFFLFFIAFFDIIVSQWGEGGLQAFSKLNAS